MYRPCDHEDRRTAVYRCYDADGGLPRTRPTTPERIDVMTTTTPWQRGYSAGWYEKEAAASNHLNRLRDELAAARARIAELEAAEQRVRRLHHQVVEDEYGGEEWCAECLTGEWPCDTIRALDAAPARED